MKGKKRNTTTKKTVSEEVADDSLAIVLRDEVVEPLDIKPEIDMSLIKPKKYRKIVLEPEKTPEIDLPSITLRVNTQDNDNRVVTFRIKRHKRLKILMEAFCEAKGKSLETYQFLLNGKHIKWYQTPDG